VRDLCLASQIIAFNCPMTSQRSAPILSNPTFYVVMVMTARGLGYCSSESFLRADYHPSLLCSRMDQRRKTAFDSGMCHIPLGYRHRLLQQPKEHVFLIPRCRGWRYITGQERIAFVFDIPSGYEPSPLSLLDLLRSPKAKLSLNEKLQVAFGLARSISQLQMVRWVGLAFSC